ncbi:MAG: protein-methionine-sulfoxide reductase catalytic subunit MsrP [Alphaproteobacteria bacterium]|jgi:sulfoxide reductase catalytic subunit YedY|nr:protein-methionine-sulfoxide reductase catalytic subunit MsrP [Alphaproteobacteria bacterium]
MHVVRRPGWAIPEREVTPEHLYLDRRRALGWLGAGAAAAALPASARANELLAGRYPAPRNDTYEVQRALTPEETVTSYNNFYEFGSSKRIARAARALELQPWEILIDGMVAEEKRLDVTELIGRMALEERVYRLRCVEAWAMTIPWTGFPMAELVKFAAPSSGARYVRMETFENPRVAPGQRQFWYPWPYVEGLTMAEATNELAFLVTGLYGRPVPNQNGAPLRLAVPWKYGFKSIKSIKRFTFTDERPVSFWEDLAADEYGFWANVNPEVPHPRWSQATERVVGSDERVPTRLFNGYGDDVAHLYDGMEDERLFM